MPKPTKPPAPVEPHEVKVHTTAAAAAAANKNKSARLYSFRINKDQLEAALKDADSTLYVMTQTQQDAFRVLCKRRFGVSLFLGEPKIDKVKRMHSVMERYATSDDPAVQQLLAELQMAQAGEETSAGVSEQPPVEKNPPETPPSGDSVPTPPADPETVEPPAPPAG